MKYALVNGNRTQATPGAQGICPICDSKVRAHCGDIRIHHWKHISKRDCDQWWESETKWHLSWKGNYPDEWQEVTMTDDQTGEKHIADVCTSHDLIIEFQHSYINLKERYLREKFYNNMVWVVDGTRLKRDYTRFLKGIEQLRKTSKVGYYLVDHPEKCFPTTWLGSKVPVIFDFLGTESIESGDPIRKPLYCLLPELYRGKSVLLIFTRKSFIKSTIVGKWSIKQKETQNQGTKPPRNNNIAKKRRGSTHYYDPRKGKMVKRWRF